MKKVISTILGLGVNIIIYVVAILFSSVLGHLPMNSHMKFSENRLYPSMQTRKSGLRFRAETEARLWQRN